MNKENRHPMFGVQLKSIEERFWSKVKKDDGKNCWIWFGAKDNYGYGYLAGTRGNKPVKAHRISYEIHFGKIPKDKCVCHNCDNPSCVNPSHLFLGTLAENNADKMRKGRDYDKQGENNPRAKIKLRDVAMIKKLWESGVTQQVIASKYGISQVNVSRIVRNLLWKNVKV